MKNFTSVKKKGFISPLPLPQRSLPFYSLSQFTKYYNEIQYKTNRIAKKKTKKKTKQTKLTNPPLPSPQRSLPFCLLWQFELFFFSTRRGGASRSLLAPPPTPPFFFKRILLPLEKDAFLFCFYSSSFSPFFKFPQFALIQNKKVNDTTVWRRGDALFLCERSIS